MRPPAEIADRGATWAGRHPVLVHIAVAVFSLELVSLAFHPVDAWWLAWIAFVPWMAYHQRRPRPGTARALMAAYYLHFASVLWWTAEVSAFGPALIPLLGLPFVAVLGWLLDRCVHRWRVPGLWAYPLAIITLEVARDHALGLTWSSAGYTQWRWLELVQVASLFRVHGASFAVLIVNAAVARLVVHFLDHGDQVSWRSAARGWFTAAVAVVLLHAAGALILAFERFEDGPDAVGIQPNIAQYPRGARRWDDVWLKHRRILLESKALDGDPDLLVCAETTLQPVHLPELPLERILGLPLVRRQDGSTITWGDFLPRGRGQMSVLGYLKREKLPPGSDAVDDDGDGCREWNVAGVVRDGAHLVAETEKKVLVPFGEYVPLPAGFPGREALKDLILRSGGFVPDLTVGTERPVTTVETPRGKFRFGCSICYEIVFPEEFRDRVRRGADFLVNISNDAWFREGMELDLVNVAVRFRAVELRRSILRVSNNGISTLVDPAGRTLDTAGGPGGPWKGVEGVVRGRIPVSRAVTPYAGLGDWPCALFPVLLGGMVLRGRRRRR